MHNLFGFFSSQTIFFEFISLIITSLTVIVGLNCIWRVEHRLKTAMSLFTAGVATNAIRKAVGLTGWEQALVWNVMLLIFDLIVSLFFVLAFVEMYKIIRTLDNEQSNDKK